MMYTLKQAGQMVGLSPDSLRRYIYDGRLKGVKQGRDWFLTQSTINKLKKRKRYVRMTQSI